MSVYIGFIAEIVPDVRTMYPSMRRISLLETDRSAIAMLSVKNNFGGSIRWLPVVGFARVDFSGDVGGKFRPDLGSISARSGSIRLRSGNPQSAPSHTEQKVRFLAVGILPPPNPQAIQNSAEPRQERGNRPHNGELSDLSRPCSRFSLGPMTFTLRHSWGGSPYYSYKCLNPYFRSDRSDSCPSLLRNLKNRRSDDLTLRLDSGADPSAVDPKIPC
jgi:hypothetical protein